MKPKQLRAGDCRDVIGNIAETVIGKRVAHNASRCARDKAVGCISRDRFAGSAGEQPVSVVRESNRVSAGNATAHQMEAAVECERYRALYRSCKCQRLREKSIEGVLTRLAVRR